MTSPIGWPRARGRRSIAAGMDERATTADEDTERPGAGDLPDESADANVAFTGSLVAVRPLPVPAPTVTLPRAGEGPLLDRVHAANATARRRSIGRLGAFFPGYDFEAAAQTSDDRRFNVLVLGDTLVDHLRAPSTVDRIVREHELGPGRLRFSHGDDSKKGARPPRVMNTIRSQQPRRISGERLVVGPVVAALRDRWTTIVNNIDSLDPVVAGVCRDLERVYGCRVNTNVYVSWGQAEGFGPHWDTHDTIIVPATGSKRWKVYEPTVLSPLRPWTDRAVSPRPVWEGEIAPGNALVIPRGWGHEVQGSDDLAVHYTIGVNRFIAHQLLDRIEAEGGTYPILRADVPYDAREPVVSYERSLHDSPTGLAEFLASLATPDLVDRALATHRARIPLRLFGSLHDTWRAVGSEDWSGLGVRVPVPAGVMLVGSAPGATSFAFGNRIVDVRNGAVDAFLALAEADVRAPDGLPEITGADGTALARELVEAGVAAIERTD